jgi:hypothetical protein
MTLQSKRELIQAIRRVYRKASKKQKSQHLDHLELVTELKRNYLNRLLLAGYKERRKRPGRQSRYARDPEFMTALKRIWVATRHLSGKLLKRSIRFYVETYQFHYGATAYGGFREAAKDKPCHNRPHPTPHEAKAWEG